MSIMILCESLILCTIAEYFEIRMRAMIAGASQAPPVVNVLHIRYATPFLKLLHMRRANMATASCPSLEDLLSHYELQRKDLEAVCPQEVRDRIALKLEDWKMVGRFLKFPPEKLKAIDRENETEDQRRVALLDEWGKREGKGATYLKLAEVLHQRGRSDLVGILCNELKKLIVQQEHFVSMESKQLSIVEDSPVVVIDVSERTETLENQFDSLHQRLMSEIAENQALSGMELLRALTMLPVSLRKEYKSSIQ